jgi:predicted nucleic acid-binding protein
MRKRVVIDTNLIFSALLADMSAIRENLLDESVAFYAPNFIIVEILDLFDNSFEV